ncbi:MAG TPA: amidophosphoribosyltransferase [Thermoplasmata archaeon]
MTADGGASEFSDLRPREKCGIIGCAARSPVVTDLYYGLRILQHRGQESAGLAIYEGEVKAKRGMGLVHEVFTKEDIMSFRGTSGIGHVRYSTTGTSVIENAQPIVARTSYGDVALAHNGDIVNADEIREDLSKKGWAFMTTSDSEVIIRLLANELVSSGDPRRALRDFTSRLNGAYSLALLINETVYAVRDPLAIRPLCIGERDGAMMIASESVVFETLGYKFIRDLKPGEIVELHPAGFESFRLPHPTHAAHCMFEWVYFARPDSVIDGRLVYDARVKIGEQLAKEHPIEADIVVPVPESGRAQAQGFAAVSGLPVVEGLIKNRYIERTFIMPDQSDREVGVMLKLNPIRSAVKNKRVVLIDDSIVRGTTIRKIVQILRQAGAREVHVRIGCPPIRSPCFLGIDMKTRNQFIANEKTVPEIAEFITANSLGYVSLRGLLAALKHPREDLCIGCLTAEYPVRIPGERMRKEKPLELFTETAVKKAPPKKKERAAT